MGGVGDGGDDRGGGNSGYGRVALRRVPVALSDRCASADARTCAGIKGSGGLVTEARDELALPSFACLVLPVPRPVTGTRARLLTFRPTVRGAVVGLQEGLMARGTARRACTGSSPTFRAGLALTGALGGGAAHRHHGRRSVRVGARHPVLGDALLQRRPRTLQVPSHTR